MTDSQCVFPSRSAVLTRALRTFAGLGGAVGLCALSACAPELNWRTVHAEQADGLSALFPCKPERFERKVPWSGVPSGVTMHMLACEAQGRNWSLSYFTLPDVTLVEPALTQWPEMMKANLGQAARALDGSVPMPPRVRDLGPIDVPRMTPSSHARAASVEGSRPDARGKPVPVAFRTWHFFHGMTVFQASVSGAPEPSDRQSSEDVAQAFFAGFQFPG